MRWWQVAALALVGAPLLAAGAAITWAEQRLDRRWIVPAREIPAPWPPDERGLAEIRDDRLRALEDVHERQNRTAAFSISPGSTGPSIRFEPFVPPADPLAGVDLDAYARKRAVARGRHLVHDRLGCATCHGEDFGGSVPVDDLPVLRLAAPNITPAGVVAGWSVADWDRIVRHGVLRGGRTAWMPSADYAGLSDRELSDLVSYLETVPPVERPSGATEVGFVGKLLVAVGVIPLVAEIIDHEAAPPAEEPPYGPTAAYGAHLGQTCAGCHGQGLSGGPIPGAPPEWKEASNLTPAPDGLAGWTEAQFLSFLADGERPDGTRVDPSMPLALTRGLDPTEGRALWAWLRSVPARPRGGR